jgi:N-methylhydantoinase A
MQANGGVLPVDASRKRPAGLYLSGPSAAVAGAAALAQATNTPSLITLDVGGTSTDICLVTQGEVHETGHGGACGSVQGQPLNQVMTDIVTIGAGGGSLAWIDAGGMLNVGPRSAGADPGPACYGRGGTGFTLSDAFLCLGLLADRANLPGRITLSLGAARDAGATLASQLGISVAELAQSVYRIAIANMAEAIRSVTVRRGLDPRDYALFACGGAGPLMAGPLAQEMDVATVLIPPDPGVFSAFGLTAAGVRMDFAQAVEQGSDVASDAAALGAVMANLAADARTQYAALGLDPQTLDLQFSADARYVGQGFELRVMFSATATPADVHAAFHEAHAQRYGHAFNEQTVELTAIRAVASSPSPQTFGQWQSTSGGTSHAPRDIGVGGASTSASVVERANLDAELAGPALCVEATTATFVPAGWQAQTEASGLLHLRVNDSDR